MLPPLCDSHCHLDFESYGEDLEDVLSRARAAGVARLVTIGAGREVSSAESAVRIARANAGWISATVGVHPHDVQLANEEIFDALDRLAADPLVVGIGETGLDYHYEHAPRVLQAEAFRRFIAMARAHKKPIIVHTRQAAADTLAILREERASDVGGVIHCFSEDAVFAKAALDLGFVSSFSGIVTFKKADAIRQAAKEQPLDAILIETDAPFLAPVPYRGKRNEPAYVARVAEEIAALRGMDVGLVRRETTRNSCRLFGLALPEGC